MKRLIISMLVLFSLTSFSLVPAFAQLPNLSLYQAAEKTQYRLRLEEGKQYYLQMINEQQMSDPTSAQEETTVMTLGTGAKLDVSNIDANGNAQVTYTYKWARLGVKFPKKEIVYDSSKKGSPVPEGMEWFAALMEESFSLKITTEGLISEIKGLDKVRSNVIQKLPPGQMNEIEMSSLNQWLDEQALRERIENSMAIYPDKPVGVGDSWSRNVAYSIGSAMILENRWTLKERKNGVAVIEVVSTIKPNPEAKPVEIGTQGVTSSSEFTGNQQGLIEMQESTGLIINSKINQQMTGKTTIKNAGRPGAPDITHSMKITGVVSMETSDWEKARSVIGTNAGALSQRTNEKVQYKLKLEEGQKYYYQTSRDGEFFDGSGYQQKPTMLQTIETGTEIAVDDIDGNGNVWATYTYRWLNIRIISRTHNIVYDSSKKAMPRSPVEQGYAALLGESFSLKITPEGRVAEIKGLDKMRSNVRKKLPPGPMQASTMESLNQYLNEEDVKHEIEESLAIYPEKPVGIGDSWGREFASSGEFAMILSNTWTLKERKNGVAVIEVVSTIKPNPKAKPSEVGNERVSFKFSGKQQGFIEIQESTGLIIRSEVNQQMSGKITTARRGVPNKVTDMKIVGVITTSMNEWEKMKSIVGTNAVAEEQPRRETPYSRTERPQRRATTFARSAAQPYLIDDEEEFVPARPRAGQETAARSLHQAVVDGDIDQVKLLISKGADVNLRNRMNWTPLHTAIQNRRQAIVELLTTKGADISAKDDRGRTPLYLAVYTSQKEMVELLIAKGADVNVMSGSDNALSLAQKRRQTEIVDLLLKHGAKEPSPEDLMGDRYYGGANPNQDYEDYGEQRTTRRGTGVIRGARTISQSPVQVDILADSDGIKARIKTFEGLEKLLEEVAGKSQNEMRQWQQKRYDNRTLLIRSVQKQFEDEIGFVRKVAVEEKAKKTTETIDSLLSGRQERVKKVSKELLAQKRALKQMQPTRGRGRARTSGRSTRGRTSQRGQPYGPDMTDPLYDRGDVMPGMNRYQSARGPSQQIDREAENEIRQWLQASLENKADLAKAVHEQIRLEISSIRSVAVEEEAKKTTATIDGLLLYRQTRFDEFFGKMEEEKQALQQTQDPRIRGRGGFPQGGQVQQQNQPRTRRRR